VLLRLRPAHPRAFALLRPSTPRESSSSLECRKAVRAPRFRSPDLFNVAGNLVVPGRKVPCGARPVRSGAPAALPRAGSKRACVPAAPTARGGSTEVCNGSKSGCPPRASVVAYTYGEVEGMEVLIGVDPHKATNSAAAVGGAGELPESTRPFPPAGRACGRFGRGPSASRSAALGRGGSKRTRKDGRPVPRRQRGARGRRRSGEALGASEAALERWRAQERSPRRLLHRGGRLAERAAALGGRRGVGCSVLRMLTERRDDLVKARTRAIDHLHALLSGIW
jgi:hypothetical protein